jgi:uncharacterized lipoprotein YddW (UPF0748 family)
VAAVGQDWESWLDAGLVDWMVPMNYVEDGAKFSSLLAQQCRTPSHARKIVSGIGVTAIESRLNVRQVIDQINTARRAGAAGIAKKSGAFGFFGICSARAEKLGCDLYGRRQKAADYRPGG